MEIHQPTLDEIEAYYRAFAKKAPGATPRCAEKCIIADVICARHPELLSVSIYPSTDNMCKWIEHRVVTHGGASWHPSGSAPLDPVLNRLAMYFDSYTESDERIASAGACVRIIQRFRKQEGL